MAKAVRMTWNLGAFEQIRRMPGVEAHLSGEVSNVLGRLAGAPGTYDGGVEAGRTRSRGYVVTADAEAIADTAQNHTLLRALGAGGGNFEEF